MSIVGYIIAMGYNPHHKSMGYTKNFNQIFAIKRIGAYQGTINQQVDPSGASSFIIY